MKNFKKSGKELYSLFGCLNPVSFKDLRQEISETPY